MHGMDKRNFILLNAFKSKRVFLKNIIICYNSRIFVPIKPNIQLVWSTIACLPKKISFDIVGYCIVSPTSR